MENAIFIINGAGGVGKDTLIDSLESDYVVRNISSITPIKELARYGGWDGEKTLKARKMLSDLKQLFTEFNDLPFNYCKDHYEFFKSKRDADFLFVAIREKEEIEKFYQYLVDDGANVHTILICREAIHKKYGNVSDDMVKDYPYQYVFHNDYELDTAKKEFKKFIEFICKK